MMESSLLCLYSIFHFLSSHFRPQNNAPIDLLSDAPSSQCGQNLAYLIFALIYERLLNLLSLWLAAGHIHLLDGHFDILRQHLSDDLFLGHIWVFNREHAGAIAAIKMCCWHFWTILYGYHNKVADKYSAIASLALFKID